MDKPYNHNHNQRNYSKEIESIQKQSLFQDKYRTYYSNDNTITKVIKEYYYKN